MKKKNCLKNIDKVIKLPLQIHLITTLSYGDHTFNFRVALDPW